MAIGLVAEVLILIAASFAFVTGCESAHAPDSGGIGKGGTISTQPPEVPPIDMLVPTVFQTASFALG